MENHENCKNRENWRFFPTLRASNSEIMASIQVSLHIHINMFNFNTNTKGHRNPTKVTATVTISNLRLRNGDNYCNFAGTYVLLLSVYEATYTVVQ